MKYVLSLLCALCAANLGIAQPAQQRDKGTLRPAAAATRPSGPSLLDARKGFHTKLLRQEHEDEAVAEPPANLFHVVQYESPAGKLAAYLSVKPEDGAKHPAMIWIFGGFNNGIDESAWKEASPSNDQSASAFRKAGLVMMYPSLRGGNKNPGFKEGCYGEVDDVLAAADFLAKQDFVDPNRIYLGGHSTGGTLAFLAACCTDRFRAVICFGPTGNVADYGKKYLTFDTTDAKELALRSPARWLNSVRSPTYGFEGEEPSSNIAVLRWMGQNATNPLLHFYPVPRLNHFSVLAPTTRLIADKIVKDTGPATDLSFTSEELAALARQ
jgi:hypothetical protein